MDTTPAPPSAARKIKLFLLSGLLAVTTVIVYLGGRPPEDRPGSNADDQKAPPLNPAPAPSGGSDDTVFYPDVSLDGEAKYQPHGEIAGSQAEPEKTSPQSGVAEPSNAPPPVAASVNVPASVAKTGGGENGTPTGSAPLSADPQGASAAVGNNPSKAVAAIENPGRNQPKSPAASAATPPAQSNPGPGKPSGDASNRGASPQAQTSPTPVVAAHSTAAPNAQDVSPSLVAPGTAASSPPSAPESVPPNASPAKSRLPLVELDLVDVKTATHAGVTKRTRGPISRREFTPALKQEDQSTAKGGIQEKPLEKPPIALVTKKQAQNYAAWATQAYREQKRIPEGQAFRLPKQSETSTAKIWRDEDKPAYESELRPFALVLVEPPSTPPAGTTGDVYQRPDGIRVKVLPEGQSPLKKTGPDKPQWQRPAGL